MGYSAKDFRKQLAETGTFYTDSKLAELMRKELGEVSEVYDPTCGRGGLLSVFPDDVRKYGQELNIDELEVAKKTLVNFEGYAGDTLQEPYFVNRKFESITANPPFSVKWEPHDRHNLFFGLPCLPPAGTADWAFIVHCYQLLKDGGTAAILCFPGALYRGKRERQLREWLIKTKCIKKIISIESGYFEDTKIQTALLVIEKTFNYESVLMIDRQNNIERAVSINEIADNDFTLSVSVYVQKQETEKETIDPFEIEQQAQQQAVERLKKELAFSKMVAILEGYNYNDFSDKIESVIRQERQTTIPTLEEFLRQ